MTVAMVLCEAHHHTMSEPALLKKGGGGRNTLRPKGTEDGEGTDARRSKKTEDRRCRRGPDHPSGAHFEADGGAHRRCVSAAVVR